MGTDMTPLLKAFLLQLSTLLHLMWKARDGSQRMTSEEMDREGAVPSGIMATNHVGLQKTKPAFSSGPAKTDNQCRWQSTGIM